MAPVNNKNDDDAQIRKIVENRVQAILDKDIDAAMAPHAPEVVMFDVVSPLRYSGSAAVRERTETWFAAYQSSIGYEVRDLSITTGESVATLCFQKTDGTWLLAHEHDSVPFDPETGKAALDLRP
jgi:ketosteroid isomerase-like protein